ncbi:MAG: ABC transporter permease [Acidobacteria bacterium]|nr:ABC transporter permease [Acidobacteriota bacterium]
MPTRWLARLVAFVRRDRVEKDLARQIEAHLGLLEEEYQRRGMTMDEARRQARLAIGGVDQAKERHRDERSFPWFEDLRRDVPYAIRGLRRTPGFTIAAVLTLALGIGATTAVLSVVDTVLLQPLPYPDSDRIVRVTEVAPPQEPGRPVAPRNITYAEFADWRHDTSLGPVAVARWDPQVMVPTPRGTVRLSVGLVTPEWFALFGTPALSGRTLVAADVSGGGVAVLSARVWRLHFGADPDVIGKTITVHSRISPLMTGQAIEIVGVMPDGFEDPSFHTDFWIPLIVREGGGRSAAAQGGVAVFGRLRGGMSVETASEEATALFAAVRKTAGGANADDPRRMIVTPIKNELVRPARPALHVLLAAVACVLVIVCANLACLLLARGSSRQREIAVRLAIGGSRGRIVRQLLAESLVLAAVGGLLGALVGGGGIVALRVLTTVDAPGIFRLVFGAQLLPRGSEIAIDGRVLVLAIGLAAATSLVFGLAPALRASRADVRQATGTRSGRSPEESRLRNLLVAGQLTMATVLLIGAALLIRSFVGLTRIDTGYNAAGVLAFQLVLPEADATPRKLAVIEDILARIEARPEVQAVGFSNAGVLVGVIDTAGYFVPPGRSVEQMRQDPRRPYVRSMSGRYLEAMGVSLLTGRTFTSADGAGAPPVVIINRALARDYFGDASPIGSALTWYGGPDGAAPVMLQVVGVIENVRRGRLQQEASPEVIFDYRQMIDLRAQWGSNRTQQEVLGLGFMSFAARTTGAPALMMPAVRAAVTAADGNAGIDAISPLSDLMTTSIARPRFYALLLSVFAAIAALLAAVGIYGVLAYAVVQRTQEIGVRIAIGASRRDVVGLVLRRGIVLAGCGIALGLAGAAGLSRYLEGLLFGVTPLDRASYAIVAIGFALVAIVASWLPARRATRVDPIVALRVE